MYVNHCHEHVLMRDYGTDANSGIRCVQGD